MKCMNENNMQCSIHALIDFLVIASLFSFTLMFYAFNTGGVETSLNVCVIAVLMALIYNDYRPFSQKFIVLLSVIVASLFLMSILALSTGLNPVSGMALHVWKLVFIVLGMHYLYSRGFVSHGLFRYILIAMISFIVFWQAVSCFVFNMPFGTYNNRHYLGSLCIVTIPFISFLFLTTDGWPRYILSAVGALALSLLLQSGSRPAIIALFVGGLSVAVFQNARDKNWLVSIMMVSTFLFISVYLSSTRLLQLLLHPLGDERWTIWTETLGMLSQNTIPRWWFGHGIGSIRTMEPQFSQTYPQLTFPHNFFLELLYDNGIAGFLLIMCSLSSLVIMIMRHRRNVPDKEGKILFLCLLATFFPFMFHCFFSFPFYSKETLYPLSLIIGTIFICCNNDRGS